MLIPNQSFCRVVESLKIKSIKQIAKRIRFIDDLLHFFLELGKKYF